MLFYAKSSQHFGTRKVHQPTLIKYSVMTSNSRQRKFSFKSSENVFPLLPESGLVIYSRIKADH